MFYVKVHDSGERKILAICDKNLIGKTFYKNGLKLEVSESFYKGELVGSAKVAELLYGINSLNVVGECSVEFCISCGILDKENVLSIQKIPYAFVFEIS